ncbi:MAG: hypothetical protein IKW76_04315 [Clostridia bacterium]|nr:hypothetical protein [Clostridia bacterium]
MQPGGRKYEQDRKKKLAEIFENDTLGLLAIEERRESALTPQDERLIDSFREISEFYESHNRAPELGEDMQPGCNPCNPMQPDATHATFATRLYRKRKSPAQTGNGSPDLCRICVCYAHPQVCQSLIYQRFWHKKEEQLHCIELPQIVRTAQKNPSMTQYSRF